MTTDAKNWHLGGSFSNFSAPIPTQTHLALDKCGRVIAIQDTKAGGPKVSSQSTQLEYARIAAGLPSRAAKPRRRVPKAKQRDSAVEESRQATPALPELEPTPAVSPDAKRVRMDALDLARGFAIALMILSHSVKGLLTFEAFPTWGLVPIHLITKFSSSLFILVFGISLAMAYLPHVGTDRWDEKRRKLLIRGITVLFWYKVLTVVEMFHLYSREDILNALMYKSFPIYVEILGFYGLALLWVPFALQLWKIAPLPVRVLVPVALVSLLSWLNNNTQIFPSPQLQALLIEHDSYYTWGQLSRAPLIFVGLLLGQAIQTLRLRNLSSSQFMFYISGALFAGFCFLAWPDFSQALKAIALNKGKHPPDLPFMSFSLGGAFLLLGLAISGGNLLAQRLSLFTRLGRDSMSAFIFHVGVIFVFYRYLFDYFQKVPYGKALILGIALIVLTSFWIRVKNWATR